MKRAGIACLHAKIPRLIETVWLGSEVSEQLFDGWSISLHCVHGCVSANQARVTAMPSLEITADDVKCAHGATITDLDEVSNAMLTHIKT